MITLASNALEESLITFRARQSAKQRQPNGLIVRGRQPAPSSLVKVTSTDAVTIVVDTLIAGGFGDRQEVNKQALQRLDKAIVDNSVREMLAQWSDQDREMFSFGVDTARHVLRQAEADSL